MTASPFMVYVYIISYRYVNSYLKKIVEYVLDFFLSKWPAPKGDGSWVDINGKPVVPYICFGDIMPSDWNILLIYYIQVILLPTSLHSNIYVPVFLPSD